MVSPHVGHIDGLVRLDGAVCNQLLERSCWRLRPSGSGNHQEKGTRADKLPYGHDSSISSLLWNVRSGQNPAHGRIVGVRSPGGLGCMRLSTEPDRDEARAIAVLHAALDAGITF